MKFNLTLAQERQALELLLQQWREMQVQQGLMEHELEDISRIAQARETSLKYGGASRV